MLILNLVLYHYLLCNQKKIKNKTKHKKKQQNKQPKTQIDSFSSVQIIYIYSIQHIFFGEMNPIHNEKKKRYR